MPNQKLAAGRLSGMAERRALVRVGGLASANPKHYRYQVISCQTLRFGRLPLQLPVTPFDRNGGRRSIVVIGRESLAPSPSATTNPPATKIAAPASGIDGTSDSVRPERTRVGPLLLGMSVHPGVLIGQPTAAPHARGCEPGRIISAPCRNAVRSVPVDSSRYTTEPSRMKNVKSGFGPCVCEETWKSTM